MAAPTPIVVDHLSKTFPSQVPGSRPVVDDLSFEVHEGEILALVGPNGAGKTTLIDLLATVLAPTCGSFRIGGRDALTNLAMVRRSTGYVPSGGRSLYPRLTVLQNLRFFAALYGLCGAEGVNRGELALRLCGAAEVSNTRVDRLSDGFVARVTLARTLLHDPDVLLLDEPARSIDPAHRPTVLRAIREYVRRPGKAAVMVTHDIDDVFAIGDAVGVLRAGRLVRLARVAAGGIDATELRRVLEAGQL